MSTMTIDPSAVAGPRPIRASRRVRVSGRARSLPTRSVPARVRLTRRGRAVVLVLALGVLLGAMVALGGFATATRTGGSPQPVRVIEVHDGDTLYGIAGRIAEPGQVRAMVHRIEELNSLPGSSVQAGQKLAIPRQ